MKDAVALLISLSSNERPLECIMGLMGDGTKKGERDTVRAEASFRAMVLDVNTNNNNNLPNGDFETNNDNHDNPIPHNEQTIVLTESPGSYAAAIQTKKLNAIGLYNRYGTEVAYTICPTLSMVNHSCLPNCQQITELGTCRLRALRDISAGEILTYSYMSLEDSEVERKSAIEDTWEFVCDCFRCQGGDCRDFDERHVCFCGAVCYEVDRTTGGCVCNEPTV